MYSFKGDYSIYLPAAFCKVCFNMFNGTGTKLFRDTTWQTLNKTTFKWSFAFLFDKIHLNDNIMILLTGLLKTPSQPPIRLEPSNPNAQHPSFSTSCLHWLLICSCRYVASIYVDINVLKHTYDAKWIHIVSFCFRTSLDGKTDIYLKRFCATSVVYCNRPVDNFVNQHPWQDTLTKDWNV